MAVKIRLQRHGRKQRPFYHIVISDSRSPRDGRYIERIGDYNPLAKPAAIHIDVDKAVEWLNKGAEPTNTVKAILKYKGILFKKHLLRGVAKGSMSIEEAEKRYAQFVEEHKNKVLDHQHKAHKEKSDRVAKLLEAEAKKASDRDRKRAEALAAAEVTAKAEEAAPAEEAPAADAPAAE